EDEAHRGRVLGLAAQEGRVAADLAGEVEGQQHPTDGGQHHQQHRHRNDLLSLRHAAVRVRKTATLPDAWPRRAGPATAVMVNVTYVCATTRSSTGPSRKIVVAGFRRSAPRSGPPPCGGGRR